MQRLADLPLERIAVQAKEAKQEKQAMASGRVLAFVDPAGGRGSQMAATLDDSLTTTCSPTPRHRRRGRGGPMTSSALQHALASCMGGAMADGGVGGIDQAP